MAEENKKYNLILISAVFLIGGFLSFLNGTLITTALPTIMKDLHISATTGQWLTTAFMLVSGIMIPCTAYLIDRFSTRKLFFASMGLFTVGTIIAGFANSFEVLIVARVLQAAGAGIIMPLMQTVFLVIYPKEKRGFAMGVVGIIIAFAPAIGPTLAGVIIDSHPWRDLFHLIAPICIIDLIFAFFALKNVKESKKIKLDIISVITSTLGFGGLLFGFSNAGSDGWLEPKVIVPLIVGVISLIIFSFKQLRSEKPMLNIRVFKSSTFTYATIIIMIAYAGLVSAELILPMYIQTARGYSAFDSGLMLMPGAIIMGIMNPITGKLFDKFGARLLSIIGLVCLTAGTFGLSFLGPDTKIEFVTLAYSIRLFGMSMFMMPLTTSGLNTLSKEDLPHGTAVNNTMRQVAGSIGTAILVTVMTKSAANSGMTNPIDAQVHGMNVAFASSAVLTLVSLILAIFVIKKTPKQDINAN